MNKFKLLTLTALLSASGAYAAASDVAAGALPSFKPRTLDEIGRAASWGRIDLAEGVDAKEAVKAYNDERAAEEEDFFARRAKDEPKVVTVEDVLKNALTAEGGLLAGKDLTPLKIISEVVGEATVYSIANSSGIAITRGKVQGVDVDKINETLADLAGTAEDKAAKSLTKKEEFDTETGTIGKFVPLTEREYVERREASKFDPSKVSEVYDALDLDKPETFEKNEAHRFLLTLSSDQVGYLASLIKPTLDSILEQKRKATLEANSLRTQLSKLRGAAAPAPASVTVGMPAIPGAGSPAADDDAEAADAGASSPVPPKKGDPAAASSAKTKDRIEARWDDEVGYERPYNVTQKRWND